MKFDIHEIKYLEEKNESIALSRLQKEWQYLYLKISKFFPEKIFTIPIKLQNGKIYRKKFIKISALQEFKRNKGYKKKI